MASIFFEASCSGILCRGSDAFAMNRKQALSSAKKFALMDSGLRLIFTYPIQAGRIEKLTSDRKRKKTLVGFNKLSEKKDKKCLTKKKNSYPVKNTAPTDLENLPGSSLCFLWIK